MFPTLVSLSKYIFTGVPNGECTSATYISSAQFCEVSCLDGKGCKPSQVQPPPPSAGCGCLPANIFAPLAYARAGASCTGMNGKVSPEIISSQCTSNIV